LPPAARPQTRNDTPERILQAALEAFSLKGFEGARTRDIATRAGVTLGLVQYHFGTKDELWKASVTRAFENLERGLDGLLADPENGDERTLLAALIRAHVNFVAQNTAFIRIMHDEGKHRGPRMRWLVDRYVDPLFKKITPVIVRAQEKGLLLPGVDPAHFVYVMVGAASMIFHQAEECKRVAGFDPSDPTEIAAHGRVVESLFLGRAT
jgi:AcrR family transcriptional regulator